MKRYWIHTLLILCAIGILTSCNRSRSGSGAAGSGGGYEKLNLTMSCIGTDIASDTLVSRRFAELVEDASGGNIKIAVFPNSHLSGGNPTMAIEMATVGTVDIAMYATSWMSTLDERLLVSTLPWVFDSYANVREIIDTTGGDFYRDVLASKGLTYISYTHNGFRQLTNGRRPIKTPADLRGLKIRVPGGEVYRSVMREFGADPVAMNWSEAFTAIQQGAVDGQENGFNVINSARVYEIQKYMTVWNYVYEPYLLFANTAIFNKLSPQAQALLREKAIEACEWGNDWFENEEDELKQKFIDFGMEVVTLSPAELQPFKAVVAGLRDELKVKFGPEASAAFRIE